MEKKSTVIRPEPGHKSAIDASASRPGLNTPEGRLPVGTAETLLSGRLPSADPGPPVLQDLAWSPGDSTVELVLTFSVVPVRYSAYALSNPDRIVLDCHRTATTVWSNPKELPLPVTRTEFSMVGVEDKGDSLLRIVLFTKRAVVYHVGETATRLRLSIDWNARLEALKVRQGRVRRAWLVGGLSGGTLIAGGAVTAAILFSGHNGSARTVLPPPDMGTPDGN